MAMSRHLCGPPAYIRGTEQGGRVSKESDPTKGKATYNPHPLPAGGQVMCPQQPIHEFPTDLFSNKERQHGAVLLHILGVRAREFSLGVFITHGDVGVGTIVGSAVFNILCIIGVCGLFAGQVVRLTWWAVCRDSVYYTLSVIVLIAFYLVFDFLGVTPPNVLLLEPGCTLCNDRIQTPPYDVSTVPSLTPDCGIAGEVRCPCHGGPRLDTGSGRGPALSLRRATSTDKTPYRGLPVGVPQAKDCARRHTTPGPLSSTTREGPGSGGTSPQRGDDPEQNEFTPSSTRPPTHQTFRGRPRQPDT
ncbi:Hypothetical predicted protein [Marmota monax]|uniref:Sodium/calcium exchanger membrane region domain-containing protein n=1 Tax=Marmota monax TaxID=9995 RepID=A0A5E4APZ1_MARMO|nr:Hypothetical predicted protein [Marmota monax]